MSMPRSRSHFSLFSSTSLALFASLVALGGVQSFQPGETQIPWEDVPQVRNGSLRNFKKIKIPFTIAVDKSQNAVISLAFKKGGEFQIAPKTGEKPENAAKNFVATELLPKGFDGASEVGLSVLNVQKSMDHSHHVRLAKISRNTEVFDEDIIVHLDNGNLVEMVDGNFDFTVEPVNKPLLTKEKSQKIAKTHLGIKSLRGGYSASKEVLFKTPEGYKHAHEVRMAALTPLGDYRVLVDRQTGQVLARENLLYHAQGSVYPLHPMAGGVETRPFNGLQNQNALKGTYGYVLNEDTDEAAGDNGSFIYPPDDTHFDEAMVYYHLNKVGEFYKTLNFNLYPIKTTVHVGNKYDNAYFSPWEKSLNFGDGNRLNDLSKEAGVIYHEYTHAVTTQMAAMRGHEGGSMHEGYSDYFACTIENDPLVGEYAVAKMGKPYMRNLESTRHYPENMTQEVHSDGEIWAAGCWSLRKVVGPKVADVIIHESRNYLPSTPKFSDAAMGILKADQKFFNGQHAQQITQVFQQRGILSAENMVETVDGQELQQHLEKFENLHQFSK